MSMARIQGLCIGMEAILEMFLSADLGMLRGDLSMQGSVWMWISMMD